MKLFYFETDSCTFCKSEEDEKAIFALIICLHQNKNYLFFNSRNGNQT